MPVDFTAFGLKQVSVTCIFLFVYININNLAIRNRYHIVEVNNGIIFHFDKIYTFFHLFMFVFKRRQRCKIFDSFYFKNNTYIFSFVLFLCLSKNMFLIIVQIFNVFTFYFVDSDIVSHMNNAVLSFFVKKMAETEKSLPSVNSLILGLCITRL